MCGFIFQTEALEFGDKPSKYLSCLTKAKTDPQTITSTVDAPGTRYYDNKSINNISMEFTMDCESDLAPGASEEMGCC